MDGIELTDVVSGEQRRLVPRRLLVAGFTGREQAEVDRHIEELRAFGAVVPDTTPVLFQLDPALLTTAAAISVDGDFTSGEVEPVVAVVDGIRMLLVGSDHTDRDLERQSLAASKEACPKVVSTAGIPVEEIADWDAVRVTSWADDDETPYQQGTLRALLALPDLERRLAPQLGGPLRDGDVLFMGTVPVTGGPLRAAARFRATLEVPDVANPLSIDYRITPSR